MMKKKLLSFHGKQAIKDAHIARLQMHFDADEIIQGKYWENGKGCDTGCSFHSNDHNQWALQLGIPVIIGHLRDRIFEGLPNEKAKLFPLACSNATPIGVDLDNVWRKFMIWLLIDDAEGVVKFAKTDDQRKAIRDIAEAFERSLTIQVPANEWWKLRAAAAAAAYAAAAAAAAADAADAAYAADAAAAAYAAAAADAAYAADAADAAAAAYAADAAAYAAAYAADAAAAAYAADAAAYAAYAADAAARNAARRGQFVKMSEKLIELLKEAA